MRALLDATAGYEGDPKLLTVFETECRGGPDCRLSQVIEGPIQFYALCEHHALPFYGHAYVGYIAHERIIGISKLTRLVRLFARRFTVQERVGQQIADALDAMLAPHGVAVYLEAHHLCTQMRGVQEASPLTRTTFWRGEYDGQPCPPLRVLRRLRAAVMSALAPLQDLFDATTGDDLPLPRRWRVSTAGCAYRGRQRGHMSSATSSPRWTESSHWASPAKQEAERSAASTLMTGW